MRGPRQDPFANIRKLVSAPVHTMKTYQIDQPLSTHYRVATCQEVDCSFFAHGWRMGFDLTDPERAQAAREIRDKSGRAYTYELFGGPGNPAGHRVVFTFKPGQKCFQTHRVPLEREPFYVVRGGDFRGNPTRQRAVHKTADTFVDSWATDLDKINTARERG